MPLADVGGARACAAESSADHTISFLKHTQTPYHRPSEAGVYHPSALQRRRWGCHRDVRRVRRALKCCPRVVLFGRMRGLTRATPPPSGLIPTRILRRCAATARGGRHTACVSRQAHGAERASRRRDGAPRGHSLAGTTPGAHARVMAAGCDGGTAGGARVLAQPGQRGRRSGRWHASRPRQLQRRQHHRSAARQRTNARQQAPPVTLESAGVGGIAVGALVCAPAHTQAAREALIAAGATLRKDGVTPFEPSLWAPADPAEADALGRTLSVARSSPALFAVHASHGGDFDAPLLLCPDAMPPGASWAWVRGLRMNSVACAHHRPSSVDCEGFSHSHGHRTRPSRRQQQHTEAVAAFEATARAGGTPHVPASCAACAEPRFTFAELFAGIGGFRLALQRTGGECVFASELDTQARATYAANFGPDMALYGDITEVRDAELPARCDMVVGGFPCQSFSARGERMGLEDPRGRLYLEVVRAMKVCQPRAVLLENVENLLHVSDGRALEAIVDDLEGAGYRVRTQIVDALHYVPQHRKRLWFVAFREDVAARAFERFEWPHHTPPAPGGPFPHAVADVLEPAGCDSAVGCALSDEHKAVIAKRCGVSADGHPRYRSAPQGFPARTLIASYKSQSAYYAELVADATAQGPGEPRYYTPRECARIMGFPEDFRLPENNRAYHQLGNAVVPQVVEALTRAIVDALEMDDGPPS